MTALHLITPLRGYAPVELVGHTTVELINVHPFDTLLQPFELRLETRNGFVMISPFDRKAVFERPHDQFMNACADPADKVPLFTAIPACARQDTESVDDFLTGKVQKRAIAVLPTAADCAVDGTGKGALVLARARMDSIALKIRTRSPLTVEEKQFVANVRTLPVYRLLEWGVRQGVVDSVIGDTDELVALTLA